MTMMMILGDDDDETGKRSFGDDEGTDEMIMFALASFMVNDFFVEIS